MKLLSNHTTCLTAFLASCISETGSDILDAISYRRGVEYFNSHCAILFWVRQLMGFIGFLVFVLFSFMPSLAYINLNSVVA